MVVLTKKLIDNELKYLYYNKKSAVSFTGKSTVHKELIKRLRNKNVKFTTKELSPLVDEWFKSQRTYTLHKAVRKKIARPPVIVKGVNEQLQMDLIDMQKLAKENRGHRFILTIVDAFSRRAWAFAIKNKEGNTVRLALEGFFKSLDKLPRVTQTDKGQEFKNKLVQSLFKKNNIKFFTTHNVETKAQLVERFNRTLQDNLYKMFTTRGHNNWVDNLEGIVFNYNNREHSSIGMKPIDVTPEHEVGIIARMTCKRHKREHHRLKKRKQLVPYKPGSYVLISKEAKSFKKSYLKGWSDEVFVIDRITNNKPLTYKLFESDGDPMEGSWLHEELQLLPNKMFRTGKSWYKKSI
jgi:hypothetical protein